MFLTVDLLTHSAIAHGFFTRQGGVSEGRYASLNCGPGSHDTPAHVEENRRLAAFALGVPSHVIHSLYQVHGDHVITVDASWPAHLKPQADALVTQRPHIALGVLTADCVPVLLADPQARVIGAAHAGWKGALMGVVERTLDAMCALGADYDRIRAGVGPAIAQASYEVGAELRAAFLARDEGYGMYFLPSLRDGHWLLDIKNFVRGRLLGAGLSHVNMLENDTYLEEDAFFSYRRATHRGEPDYGRQISAIMLRE